MNASASAIADRLHPACRRGGADRRGRQGLRRRRGPRCRARARSVVVERARQAQYRLVRCRAPACAGGDRVEPRHRPRQGADRRAVRAGGERQRHHGVARALRRHRRRGGRQHRRSDGVGARARPRRRQAQGQGRGAADLRDDLPVLDPQLSSALLDGGRRRRSRRGCPSGRAAAALHGRQPRQRTRRRLLRGCALEFGRGRPRRRLHPAFRVGDPAARGREGAGDARPLGAGAPRHAAAAGARPWPRGRLHRGRSQPRRGGGDPRRARSHRRRRRR